MLVLALVGEEISICVKDIGKTDRALQFIKFGNEKERGIQDGLFMELLCISGERVIIVD